LLDFFRLTIACSTVGLLVAIGTTTLEASLSVSGLLGFLVGGLLGAAASLARP
jgi:hypothetical protein